MSLQQVCTTTVLGMALFSSLMATFFRLVAGLFGRIWYPLFCSIFMCRIGFDVFLTVAKINPSRKIQSAPALVPGIRCAANSPVD